MSQNPWFREEEGACPYWTLPTLHGAKIFAAFSTRHGGVSDAPFASLNLSDSVGDLRSNVWENRRRWHTVIGAHGFEWVQTMRQVHGVHPRHVVGPQGPLYSPGWRQGSSADAQFTSEKGLLLGMYYADCVPIILLCRSPLWVGLIHVGWRGLFAGVIDRTIQQLREVSRLPADSFEAFFGPSIDVTHYEVDAPVLGLLRSQLSSWQQFVYPARPGHVRLDMAGVAGERLQQAGLSRSAITPFPGGTATCTDFYSHRRDGTTGRCMAFVGIVQE